MSRPKAWGTRVFFSTWFALMVLVSAVFLGRHLLALPRPDATSAALRKTVESLAPPASEHRVFALHVLYAECKCSRRIAEHLLESERPAGLAETVLLVGSDSELETRLLARGFGVTLVSETEVSSRYGISAVPLLVVAARDGAIRYVGGYTSRKQGLAARDLDVIRAVTESQPFESLPVFGCAVAEELGRRLDPTGSL